MAKTGLIFDFSMVAHHSYQHPHPELPSRLHKLIDYLLAQPELKESKSLDIIEYGIPCLDQDILLIHSKKYVEMLKSMNFKLDPPIYWYLDTYFMDQTLESAYMAVGILIEAIDRMNKNEWGRALALVRPPGHHVGVLEKPNGFCVFNNVAIAAQYLIMKSGYKKVLIFDWDVHHGDGTQELFYTNDQVLLISIHRYDNATFYPAHQQADVSYVGDEKGKGFNINIPWNILPDQTATTDDYIYVFERVLAPIIKSFAPEFVLISAGFDSAKGDPLGGLELTNEGYAYMTKRLIDLTSGKLLAVLEGGYNLKSLSSGVKSVLDVLRGEPIDLENLLEKLNPNDVGLNACEKALDVLTEYWPTLKTDEKALNLKILKDKMEKGSVKKFQQSAGHAESFKVLGDKIFKLTGLVEAQFYEDLYSKSPLNFTEKDAEIMKSFIPRYFGMENTENKAKPNIILENLLIDKEFGSLLDMKMGSKGLINNPKKEKKLAELAKSRISTSSEFGFRLTGLIVKDKIGKTNLQIKCREAHLAVNKMNLRDYLKKFLLSNEEETINKIALKYYIDFMRKLEKFLEERCKVKFSCVSLFFILDNRSKSHMIKLIDFSYWEKCQETDDNISNGVKNLRKIFEEFL